MHPEIQIVNIAPAYAQALEQLQIVCFPTLAQQERMVAEQFLHHSELFPEGNFVALAGDSVVGLGSGFFIDFDFAHPHHTFLDIIANGWYTHHNPAGAYYYGADISVHPDFRGHGIGRLLYEARKGAVRQYNKKGIVAGGILPGYPAHRQQLTALEYIAKVVAGELFDPTLSFQLRNGFTTHGLLQGYFHDDTDNYAVLIYWENPDYRGKSWP